MWWLKVTALARIILPDPVALRCAFRRIKATEIGIQNWSESVAFNLLAGLSKNLCHPSKIRATVRPFLLRIYTLREQQADVMSLLVSPCSAIKSTAFRH